MRITDDIILADWELSEQFMRASGPGGQKRKQGLIRGGIAL